MATYWRVIRYTPTSSDGVKYLERLQGIFFDFKVGDTVYDIDNLPYAVGFVNYYNSLSADNTRGYKYIKPTSIPFPVVIRNGSYRANLIGFSMVYRRNSDSETDTAIEGVCLGSSAEISGKWRVKSGISSPVNYLIESTVNVKYTLKGANYIAMVFPNNNNTDYSFTRTGELPVDVGSGSDCYNVGGYTEYPEFLTDGTLSKTPDVVLFNDEFNSPNLTNIAGEIIDFGSFPQEVPAYYVNWLYSMADPVYPYTYTVKSQNGENVLALLEEAPAMVNVTLSTVGNVKTMIMIDANEQTYRMTWESETPEGKKFLGLSNSPNSNRVIIPANTSTPVSWVGDIVLYEAYGTYRPPATTFDINLYQNSAEVNRVDKGNYLVGVGTLSGALREECSMLTPSIVYQSSEVPSFNYVYIPIFNRYYFVTSLSSVSKNVWRMELNCDVLMSYKNEILLLQGVVGRQEIDFNPMLVDSELPTQDNPDVTILNIPSTAFKSHTNVDANFYNFVLTVIG